MASNSKRKSFVQYLHVMGTDLTFVVVSKPVCAADWEQDPWTTYMGFAIHKNSWWILTAIDLQKVGVSRLEKYLFSKKNPNVTSCHVFYARMLRQH